MYVFLFAEFVGFGAHVKFYMASWRASSRCKESIPAALKHITPEAWAGQMAMVEANRRLACPKWGFLTTKKPLIVRFIEHNVVSGFK
jgi:hypothetical protein